LETARNFRLADDDPSDSTELAFGSGAQRMLPTMHHQTSPVTETLDRLQRTWTRLVMSGKPNGLAEKPDLLKSLERIAGEFTQLRTELGGALGETRERETAIELGTRAQIAIDILIRNLFERTADVGFLAEDSAIIDDLAAGAPASPEALRARLDEYVAKYSVYDDIGVFRPNGDVHVTRLGDASRLHASDQLVAAALARPGVFHEVFRLGPDFEPQLLYAQSIPGPNRTSIGVLALSFRFSDEMASIFASLLKGASAGFRLGIVDSADRVIAGSAGLQAGSTIKLDAAGVQAIALDKVQYFATRRPTRGYQGFSGLGWSGVALRPASSSQPAAAQGGAPDKEHDERQIAASGIVTDGLKRISRRAYAIDSDLHLIGLNGKIAADRENNRVLPVVLASIREVGEQIRNTVHGAIGVLYGETHRNIGQEAGQMAALGIDIMDRNLYERANDCRWWALTPYFRTTLAEKNGNGQDLDAAARREIARILAYINGLYTVYSTLFVFDAQGRVIADSRDGASGRIGETLKGGHIEAALAGRNTQAYSVSDFVASPLYGDRPTYVYCGSILAPDSHRAVGGVAVVFDSEPQFRQMLTDILPLNDKGVAYYGSFAAFVNAKGVVISSTDDQRQPGTMLDPAAIADFRVLAKAPSRGYREFKTSDGYRDPVTCLVAIPG
jgi:hypothetical protein